MSTSTTSTDGLRNLASIYSLLLQCEAAPMIPNGFPRYLFRGENDGYPETLTSMDRHYHGPDGESVYEDLDALTAFVMQQPFPQKGLKGREAGAYAQHYGLPTQIFDFTSSAKVAVFFAANGPGHSAEGGNMLILDVAKALRAGCLVEDLRHHQFAKRAAMQHAFGLIYTRFRVDDFYNLKDPELVEELGLIWVPFAHMANDGTFLKSIGASASILNTTNDPFASLAQEFVDEYVAVRGRIGQKAAAILAKNVPPIGRTIEQNRNRWSL